MPRKKRTQTTPVAKFIRRLQREKGLTAKAISDIAGCSPSIISSWSSGSSWPCEAVIHLKKLCEHFGESFSVALTGEPERKVKSFSELDSMFDHVEVFDGYAKIKLVKLVLRK